MPTYNLPQSPVPALEPFEASVVYNPDQNAQSSKLLISINNALLVEGDYLVFNGIAWRNKALLTTPTDFTDGENFVQQFNENPDFSSDYVATVTSITTTVNITIEAKVASKLLDIESDTVAVNPSAITINANYAGQSTYSKNDIASFAQLARVQGTTVDNEQVNEGSTYYFELSSQIQSQLRHYDIADSNGVLFLNEGSYKDIGIQFGTRYTEEGSTYRIRNYSDSFPFFAYMGKSHNIGYLSNRDTVKRSSTELYEAISFLLHDYTDTATLQRRIDITYTDNTSYTFFNGTLNNPFSGIVTALAYVDSFSSVVDNSKTIRQWTVSLADSEGNIVYDGQTYSNLQDDCVNYFQLLFTNVYGGIEVMTFKTNSIESFEVSSQEAKEASLPNTFKEFNFVTDTTELVSIDEQAITEKDYTILKSLPQSKYLYIAEGNTIKPVRLTNFKLTENTFNGNFKCLG